MGSGRLQGVKVTLDDSVCARVALFNQHTEEAGERERERERSL